jgi:hypothetical protein
MCFLFNNYVHCKCLSINLWFILTYYKYTIYGVDGTESSLFYCKFKAYFNTICPLISWTCFCLATIDQYCATCSRPRFQQWCNIKLAQRLTITSIIIWILHTIPYVVLYYQVVSPITGIVSCTMTNTVYIGYGIVFILVGFLPISISILFGLMACVSQFTTISPLCIATCSTRIR